MLVGLGLGLKLGAPGLVLGMPGSRCAPTQPAGPSEQPPSWEPPLALRRPWCWV